MLLALHSLKPTLYKKKYVKTNGTKNYWKSTENIIPTLKENSMLYETNLEKANHIAKNLQSISKNSNSSKTFKRRKHKFEQKWLNKTYNKEYCEMDRPFSLLELQNAIKGTKNNKSPGEDQITYEVIKHLPENGLEYLLHIYNKFWEKGYLHAGWKSSIVIPIPKAGVDPSNVNSYRPISLISVLCKLMERLVTSRITWYLEEKKLLNKEQTGFRRGKSTTDHLIRLHDSANKALNNRECTQAVFLDLTKAFDTLWIAGLLLKLRKLGINNKAYYWI